MSVPLARLLITCPDAPGIVAAVTTFLRNHDANIMALDQHSTDHLEVSVLGAIRAGVGGGLSCP